MFYLSACASVNPVGETLLSLGHDGSSATSMDAVSGTPQLILSWFSSIWKSFIFIDFG